MILPKHHLSILYKYSLADVPSAGLTGTSWLPCNPPSDRQIVVDDRFAGTTWTLQCPFSFKRLRTLPEKPLSAIWLQLPPPKLAPSLLLTGLFPWRLQAQQEDLSVPLTLAPAHPFDLHRNDQEKIAGLDETESGLSCAIRRKVPYRSCWKLGGHSRVGELTMKPRKWLGSL